LLELVRSIPLSPPRIPWLSNVTGTWMEPARAIDPAYWVSHLLSPVRFAGGIAELWREPGRILLEMGPGQTLGSLALQQIPEGGADRIVLSSLRHELDRQPDQRFLLHSLGRLWLAGMDVDWSGFDGSERRRRVPLPAYPFERQRYWIEPGVVKTPRAPERGRWLVLLDPLGLGDRLAQHLTAAGCAVETARVAQTGEAVDFDALLSGLGWAPDYVLHLWSLGEDAARGGRPVFVIHWGRGLTAEERMQALDRILESGLSEVVVSNRDLATAIHAGLAAAPESVETAEVPAAAAPGRKRHPRPALQTPWAAPATATEEQMAALWGELLGIEPIGAHDNFFELGGHSLLGLQVLSRIQARLGAEISLETLFEAPTVAALAAEVDARRRRDETAVATPIVPVPRELPLPLSFAQQRLWFIDQLEPGSPLYNIPVVLRGEGPLDSAVL